MLFRKSYLFIVFIFNLILVSFHFVKNLNFSGTTNYDIVGFFLEINFRTGTSRLFLKKTRGLIGW
ncbi:hypothetical protein LEP1GSC133_0823 [Leptospira borgpetersenii serovar Pomona str. 200901868]|uniref:Uncharacterized protein n=1 Tax=Leptospira borgpetersenii serovar Pomona str. 200901868 TaxID=1192866 RepID=M6W9K2_LEPBO|nr:hypothetical protein LEP1GSC133_0823 [Leptospira borgpetersenii serovar Pomona str. 200901868]